MPYEYEIVALNQTEYQLTLIFEAENRIMRDIFNRAKEKLSKDKGIKAQGNPDVIGAFDVPQEFLKTLKFITKKQLKEVFSLLHKEDNFTMISNECTSSKFKRFNEKWLIYIVYKGMYKK